MQAVGVLLRDVATVSSPPRWLTFKGSCLNVGKAD